MYNKLLYLLFIFGFTFKSFSQCSTCTTCTTTSSTGCTYSLSSSSSSNYTLNSGQKLCITGGTFNGKLSLNGGTAVIDGGAVFTPSSVPVAGSGNLIEVKSTSSATIPGLNIASDVSLTLNNCGT